MPERIRTLICEQIVLIISTLTAFVTGTATIVLSVTGNFGGGGGGGGRGGRGGVGGLPSKDKGTLKKWLDSLADALKILEKKSVEALPAIVGSDAGAILSLLSKAVEFLAKHTLALIVYVAGLIGVWLIQRV